MFLFLQYANWTSGLYQSYTRSNVYNSNFKNQYEAKARCFIKVGHCSWMVRFRVWWRFFPSHTKREKTPDNSWLMLRGAVGTPPAIWKYFGTVTWSARRNRVWPFRLSSLLTIDYLRQLLAAASTRKKKDMRAHFSPSKRNLSFLLHACDGYTLIQITLLIL